MTRGYLIVEVEKLEAIDEQIRAMTAEIERLNKLLDELHPLVSISEWPAKEVLSPLPIGHLDVDMRVQVYAARLL